MNVQSDKSSVRPVRFAGTGSAVPDPVLTNADLEKIVDTSDEWIVTRTGIRERRIAPEGLVTSDLALPAAKTAMEEAGVGAEDLDGIICATVTPDQVFPSMGCTLQSKLGAKRAFAFDVSAACSGFLYSLSVAQGMIASWRANTVLVVGAELLSRVTNWSDRTTCILLADGAGAAILQPGDEEHGILSLTLGADGNFGSLIEQPAGGSKLPASEETVRNHLHCIHMRGNEVFKMGVRTMADECVKALGLAGYGAQDVDLLVTHQANLRIIEATAKRLGISPEKVFTNIQKYGNTSAASIPIALDEARKAGRLHSGDLVALVGFGGGLTWGAAVVRW
ncbi:MAG: beta-ketoacyl-ACP synthase III [Candidatus Eisenbacteria bacterium]|nr:beta-ketoacyl-ACP synthase III [Candidatus Latescibacterota bacterium]MBD3302383.1 beta-ketoacyl-ACP synthase III [Candidatus Eisenbacteria bacterium]